MNGPLSVHIEQVAQHADAWTRPGVRDLLTGAAYASLQTLAYLPDTPTMLAYRAGIETALQTVCLAFGLAYRPQGAPVVEQDNQPY